MTKKEKLKELGYRKVLGVNYLYVYQLKDNFGNKCGKFYINIDPRLHADGACEITGITITGDGCEPHYQSIIELYSEIINDYEEIMKCKD